MEKDKAICGMWHITQNELREKFTQNTIKSPKQTRTICLQRSRRRLRQQINRILEDVHTPKKSKKSLHASRRPNPSQHVVCSP
jgi:hypothetical protein